MFKLYECERMTPHVRRSVLEASSIACGIGRPPGTPASPAARNATSQARTQITPLPAERAISGCSAGLSHPLSRMQEDSGQGVWWCGRFADMALPANKLSRSYTLSVSLHPLLSRRHCVEFESWKLLKQRVTPLLRTSMDRQLLLHSSTILHQR